MHDLTQRLTDPLLTPAEVAALFRVAADTVVEWAQNGKLKSTKTPGGHHRFRESVVIAALDAEAVTA